MGIIIWNTYSKSRCIGKEHDKTLKGDVLMERIIHTKICDVDYSIAVYDTDSTPLRDLMKKKYSMGI